MMWRMRRALKFAAACFIVAAPALHAQRTGQPASDVLMQFDVWGNPTFRGGVTNNGPNSHSVW